MYKQYKDVNGQVITNAIIRISDGATVPFDESNTDYQEYLKWVAEGNTPLPAENE
jgi:hypothetical protein